MKITREIQGVMADHFTIDLPKPFRNTPLQIMITTLPLTRKSRSVIGLWKDRFSNNKSSAEIQSEQREAQWPGNELIVVFLLIFCEAMKRLQTK